MMKKNGGFNRHFLFGESILSWIYWLLLILFYFLNSIGMEHYFIRVFYSPLEEIIWLFYPFFASVSIYINLTKNNNNVLKLLYYIFSALLGAGLILFFNFKIIPIVVLLTTLILVSLLYKRKIRLNISLILMIFGTVLYFSQYGSIYLNWFRIIPQSKIKLITYNLSDRRPEIRLKALKDICRQTHPDIICLQEVIASDRPVFEKEFIKIFPYQHYPSRISDTYQGGIILSRIPFDKKFNTRISNRYATSSMAMNFVRLALDSTQTLALYNIHLISNGFGLRNAYAKKYSLNKIVELERINYIKRSDEARNVLENIDFSESKIIVAGDFNDIIGSKVLRYFSHKLDNSWERAGTGHYVTFGYRYIASLFQMFGLSGALGFDFVGIDHAFVSEDIEVCSIEVLNLRSSDHRPVLFQFSY